MFARMFALKAVLLLAAVAVVRCAEGPTDGDLGWTYGQGIGGELPPSRWPEKYPDCGGKRQSPILLSAPLLSECKTDSASWVFTGGNCALGNAKAESRPSNWGEVAFKGCQPQLKTSKGTYNLLQIHFHSSAEHILSGNDFAAEAHFVHQNVNDPNDLKVVGVFLQLQAEIVTQDNLIFEPMLQVLSSVNENGVKFELDYGARFDPYGLLPVDTRVMIYPGSLTTPPCAETVTWVIFEQPVGISRRQLELYRKGEQSVAYSPSNTFGNNNRPLQDLNDRKIEYCEL